MTTGAQLLAKNPIFHSKSKHIDVKHHAREVFHEDMIEIRH